VVVVHRKACAVVDFSTVREAKQNRAAVAANLNVSLTFVVKEGHKHLQCVKLDIADHACFVIAVPYKDDMMSIWLEPFNSTIDNRLEVVAYIMLGPYFVLVPTRVPTPLH